MPQTRKEWGERGKRGTEDEKKNTSTNAGTFVSG